MTSSRFFVPAEISRQPIPIGRPIANTVVYILDRYLNPVPVGVMGELYIGGVGLARGYLRRPALTAERFVPNPFAEHPGERLYRTGDLARYLPDGNIEFIGRIDHQVKIRGFRVELGEIESVLAEHPAVREAVVLARGETTDDKRLVAYIVPAERAAPSLSAIRDHLKERLPDYMLPAAVVFLAALPLTPNGKVDRRALPAPDATRPELASAYLAPRTPVEEVLAGIWADVLNLERVGVHDNFFELGGDSLSANRALMRIAREFGQDISLRDMLDSATPAALALLVHGEHTLSADPLPRMPSARSTPLSFAQQRLWFIDRLLPGSALYNIPIVARLRGPLAIDALE